METKESVKAQLKLIEEYGIEENIPEITADLRKQERIYKKLEEEKNESSD